MPGRSADRVFSFTPGDSPVSHCPFLPRTIFASLARANERARVQNVRDFPQTELDSEINARFLLKWVDRLKNDDIHEKYDVFYKKLFNIKSTELFNEIPSNHEITILGSYG